MHYGANGNLICIMAKKGKDLQKNKPLKEKSIKVKLGTFLL